MQTIKILPILLIPLFFLSACSPFAKQKKPVQFSNDDSQPFPTLVDSAAKEEINTTKEFKMNQTAIVTYKTTNPDGVGTVEYKAKKLTEVAKVGDLVPEDGKKLLVLDFTYKGSSKNKGQPTIINQIGQTPAPQFVLLDRQNKTSIVETTEFSDANAASKKLFELYKLTLDNDKQVDTALVFEVDKNMSPELAIRFTNSEGKTEFYLIKQ